MVRTLIIVFSCACTAIVLSEAGLLFLLWQRGMLTSHNVREIRLILMQGETPETSVNQAAPVSGQIAPSLSQVAAKRSVKVLELDRRDGELESMSQQVMQRSRAIADQLADLGNQRESFRTELKTARDAVQSSATEQTRGVLLKLKPTDAVDYLLGLTLEDNVMILRGMSEPAIAKILKEFNTADTTDTGGKKSRRGKEIFEALSRGAPESGVVAAADRKLAGAAAATPAAPNTNNTNNTNTTTPSAGGSP
jgi:hypothetical protein